jgi:hypothetical protein
MCAEQERSRSIRASSRVALSLTDDEDRFHYGTILVIMYG